LHLTFSFAKNVKRERILISFEIFSSEHHNAKGLLLILYRKNDVTEGAKQQKNNDYLLCNLLKVLSFIVMLSQFLFIVAGPTFSCFKIIVFIFTNYLKKK